MRSCQTLRSALCMTGQAVTAGGLVVVAMSLMSVPLALAILSVIRRISSVSSLGDWTLSPLISGTPHSVTVAGPMVSVGPSLRASMPWAAVGAAAPPSRPLPLAAPVQGSSQ
ncbi:hypothetical protein LEMLEM_LOCUS12615 [Lemmus lemmus]